MRRSSCTEEPISISLLSAIEERTVSQATQGTLTVGWTRQGPCVRRCQQKIRPETCFTNLWRLTVHLTLRSPVKTSQTSTATSTRGLPVDVDRHSTLYRRPRGPLAKYSHAIAHNCAANRTQHSSKSWPAKRASMCAAWLGKKTAPCARDVCSG